MGIGLGLGIQFYKKAGARLSAFLTWGQSVPARFWGTETPEYWGGIDPQAQIAYDSLIAAGFTTPQGLGGINAAFSVVKEIYGTSDITTAISFFGDPSLAYEAGAGTGTTAGQAIRTLPNIIDPTRATDAVQTTAASQPLLLTHTSGSNYFWISGDLASNCTTPNAVANQITGDIEIIYRGSFDNNPSTNNLYVSKWESSGLSYFFGTNNTGNLRVGFNIGGTSTFANSSVAYATGVNWYRVSRVASTGVVTFFQSTENTSNINSVNWVQLGTTQSTVSGNITSTNSIVSIYRSADQANRGRVFRATISNSIGGAPVVDFNPNQYNASNSQTQWTSSTGEVWTINTGTATSGYKGVLVDRTIVQGDGVDDSLATSSTINLGSVFTLYAAFKGYNNEGGSGRITFGKQNIDGAVFRNSLVNIGSWIGAGGGIVLNQTATSLNLNLATFKRKVSSNTLQVNNGAIATNTGTNPIVQSNISVFFATSYGFSNSLITSGIISKLEDDTTQKTSMYNYIRSINNAAF